MRPPLLLTLIAVASGLSAALLWGTEIPLGVAGEWTWPRIPFSAETLAGLLMLIPAAVVYVGWVAWASQWLSREPGRRAFLPLAGLFIAGFLWLTAVQTAVPGVAGLSKAPFVLYYPRSSGYFWQARYEVATTADFLAGYEELMAERDYLHIGTHPPGLTLMFRGLLQMLEGSPALQEAVLATQPAAVEAAVETIRQNSQSTSHVFNETDAACLWLWTLLVQLSAAAVVVPLFLLLAERVDRAAAYYAVALWPLVPAVAVFLPKSDVLFPFLSLLAAWLWFRGWRRRTVAACAAAGFVLWWGMMCSLAFLPTAAIITLWTLLDAYPGWHEDAGRLRVRESVRCLVGGACGFFGPLLILWAFCDLNLFAVWRWNLENHALFYDHNVRTAWKWLLINPLELTFAAGAPLAMLAIAGVIQSLRGRRHLPLVVAMLTIWGLLWLSGKNMGEAARLWIILMPWLVVAAGLLEESGGLSQERPRPSRRLWLTVVAAQMLVSALTVTRIDGFHFDQLEESAAAADQTALRGILTGSVSGSSKSSATSQRSRPRFLAR